MTDSEYLSFEEVDLLFPGARESGECFGWSYWVNDNGFLCRRTLIITWSEMQNDEHNDYHVWKPELQEWSGVSMKMKKDANLAEMLEYATRLLQ